MRFGEGGGESSLGVDSSEVSPSTRTLIGGGALSKAHFWKQTSKVNKQSEKIEQIVTFSTRWETYQNTGFMFTRPLRRQWKRPQDQRPYHMLPNESFSGNNYSLLIRSSCTAMTTLCNCSLRIHSSQESSLWLETVTTIWPLAKITKHSFFAQVTNEARSHGFRNLNPPAKLTMHDYCFRCSHLGTFQWWEDPTTWQFLFPIMWPRKTVHVRYVDICG